MSSSPSNATVHLVLDTGTTDIPLDTIDEARIRAHSKTIRDALDARPSNASNKRVNVFGAAPAPLKYIIERIKGSSPSGKLHVKVHDMPLLRAVAVWEACEVLQLEPKQTHVEGHVLGHISHNQVTPDEMMAVAIASHRRRETSRVYDCIIQQVAWGLVHAKYSPEEAEALQKKAVQWREFHDELDARVQDLKIRREAYDAHHQARASRG